MKAILVCIAITCVAASSSLRDEEPRRIEYVDDKGILRVIDLDDDSPATERFVPDDDIVYLLYTRFNSTHPFRIYKRDEISLWEGNFNPRNPVKIGIHGWNGDATSGAITLMAPAFLEVEDVNFIGVDWSKGSTGGYTQSVRNVQPAGASIADMIDWLHSLGVPYSDFHLMGHSLGGHVVAFSGRLAQGTIGIITALDPASPSWGPTSQRLNKTDAEYVEVIHTNSGQLGLLDAVGHNDFYPNGGVDMPGCSGNIYCSHALSVDYLAYSMDHKGFMGTLCDSVTDAVDRNCTGNGELHMGGVRPKPGDGMVYALDTSDSPPYYLGTP